MEDNKMIIKDVNGNEISYDIITAFILPSTKKNYIVYTDNTYTDNNELNIYASIYHPNDLTKLDDVETEEEWEYINEMLEGLK